MEISQFFDGLIELYARYSNVYRRTISWSKFKDSQGQEHPVDAELTLGSKLFRETLLEHVGSLPIIAAYLHPHLEHAQHVNLGKVLSMLAIHDIGETVVGDGHPHRKSPEFIDTERRVALALLSSDLHGLFEECEAGETLEAKYAKSVDVFSTFLADQLIPPTLVRQRLIMNGFPWEEIEKKRYEVFAWDAFLKELFNEVGRRYREIDTLEDSMSSRTITH
jgi:hypothetical protein